MLNLTAICKRFEAIVDVVVKEWDTAASQVIVEQAGGIFLDTKGNRIMYNREDVYNRIGYVICNRIENFLL